MGLNPHTQPLSELLHNFASFSWDHGYKSCDFLLNKGLKPLACTRFTHEPFLECIFANLCPPLKWGKFNVLRGDADIADIKLRNLRTDSRRI